MGEFQYLHCKTKVYKFGVLWFWKCAGASKCAGGREREWGRAFDRAVFHARAGIRTYTYRDEENETDALV